MYAVIATGGKQYRVSEGESIKIETLVADVGASVDFPVLMVGAGENIHLGTPHLKNAKVTATVVSHGRGEKIKIVKMRRRKHYRKQMGHRQNYTEVKITKISA